MSEITYRYFDLNKALELHKFIILNSGGLIPIVVNEGLLDSVLHHVKEDLYYPEFVDKVAHLVFGVNKNHAFKDGNKRASLAFSSLFLELNDHGNSVPQYTHGMEEVVVWVAKSLVDKETLKKIIEFLLYEEGASVAYFVAEAKKYRPYIEPQDAPIQAHLLGRMIDDWLSNEGELSEATKVAVLEVIDPGEFSSSV